MRILLALSTWLLLGVPVALAFRQHQRTRLGIAMLPFAGILAISAAPVIAGLLGLPLAQWPVLAAFASIGLGVAAFFLLKGSTYDPGGRVAHSTAAGTVAAVLAIVLIGITNLSMGGHLSEGWPAYEWDGFSIWLLRAKVLAESATFPAALFSEPQIADSHWDYPLLLPSLFAWFMRIGGLEVHQLTIVIGIVAAIIPTAIAIGLSRTMPPSMAVAIGLCPYVIPGLVRTHYGAYADPLMVMFIVATIAWLSMGIALHDRAQIVAAAFSLAAVVATKNEGMLWALAILAMTFFLMARHFDIVQLGTTLVRVGSPAMVYFVSWKFLCGKLDAKNDLMGSLNWAALPERFGEVYVAVCQEVMALETLILLVISVGCIVLFSSGSLASRLRSTLACLSAPLLYCAGMILIYSSTPHDLTWHLDTALSRTMYGVLPAIMTMAICAYVRDLQPSRGRSQVASLSNSLY